MQDIILKDKTWKYFINLPSSEFPIRTNAELVKILQIYNGANDIEGISQPHRMLQARYKLIHIIKDGHLYRTNSSYIPPPHNISITKGSAYGVFSRAFVQFSLTDKRALDLLEWSKKIYSPDEYYWATLNHDRNIRAPGSYLGQYSIRDDPFNFTAHVRDRNCFPIKFADRKIFHKKKT